MKQFVISGMNLFEGGPLSVFYDCLDAVIETDLINHYEVVAFVHRKDLFEKYQQKIRLIELPKSRKNYLFRLYYEYLFFYQYSRQNEVEVWLSLHDITPNVRAKRIYTYCHNVSPFIKKQLKNIKYGIKDVLFSWFYKYLYRINIKKATAIIVQTQWMRAAFLKMYPINNVIVARPHINIAYSVGNIEKKQEKAQFIYPTLPRYFKNIQMICEAAKRLNEKECDIIITVDGTENSYSKEIYTKYHSLKVLKWVGRLPRQKVFELYDSVNCLVFPSSIETWGLPISEFRQTGKDIILIDLPYARETLGRYDRAMFFKENSVDSLLLRMKSVIDGTQQYSQTRETVITPPYAKDWQELIALLTTDDF